MRKNSLKSVVQEKTLKELMVIVRSCSGREEALKKISEEFGLSIENAEKLLNGL